VSGSAGAEALKHLTGPKKPVHAVIEMLTRRGLDDLRALFEGKMPK
jgi:hypothetical protein